MMRPKSSSEQTRKSLNVDLTGRVNVAVYALAVLARTPFTLLWKMWWRRRSRAYLHQR